MAYQWEKSLSAASGLAKVQDERVSVLSQQQKHPRDVLTCHMRNVSMSQKLDKFYPELKDVPKICGCGKPATDKKGVTRFIGEVPHCRECYQRKLGRAKIGKEESGENDRSNTPGTS